MPAGAAWETASVPAFRPPSPCAGLFKAENTDVDIALLGDAAPLAGDVRASYDARQTGRALWWGVAADIRWRRGYNMPTTASEAQSLAAETLGHLDETLPVNGGAPGATPNPNLC